MVLTVVALASARFRLAARVAVDPIGVAAGRE
jgi:hypothetical protein